MKKSVSVVVENDLHDDDNVQYKSRGKGPKRVHQYVLGEQLGEGSFGKVREAIDSRTLKRVAIKIIKKRLLRKVKDGEEILKNEIQIMKKLKQHENVIKLIEVIHNEEKDKMYIVEEFAGAGSLQQLIESNPNNRLPLSDVHHFFKQLIEGLEYIHNQGVIHRDIKPANLMITPDRVLKISDFGVACMLDKFSNSNMISQSFGSPAFQSPQIAMGIKNFSGFKLDIWAAGVTLYVLVVGKPPFEGGNIFQLYEKIAQCSFEIPDWVDDDIRDLIQNMMKKSEEERFSINQIKEHHWYKTERYLESQNATCQLIDRWRSSSLLPYIEKAVANLLSSHTTNPSQNGEPPFFRHSYTSGSSLSVSLPPQQQNQMNGWSLTDESKQSRRTSLPASLPTNNSHLQSGQQQQCTIL